MTEHKTFWAVVPAAGVGQRMRADRPKQYLELHGKTVLEHSLMRLLELPEIQGVILALDQDDQYWPELRFQHSKPVLTVSGGKERCDSVLNALRKLEQQHPDCADDIWVLVHDAARPCVRSCDLEQLIDQASHDDHGGLLALPVRDTMKRQKDNNRVQTTVDRKGLWHALTPQMFKLKLLRQALEQALTHGMEITDDASAMELAGYSPLLVEGHEDNIKITRPFDLTLAGLYLKEQLND
ncbi:MAG: 2-C-methyl-D-erythritol 4-phosphate cytidylyltransferase [Gammaproteobacteria bacterium]|nr:MAG: 2-C-methyl-D-erythritol 4-phosphate cytidylyltransferase [Gammaproteobacteria bacterium]